MCLQIFKVDLFWQNIKLVLKSKMQSTFFTSLPKKLFSFPRQIFFLSCFFFNTYFRCGRSSLKKRFFVFCGTQAKWEEGSFDNVDHRSSIRLEQATLSITNDRSHPERQSSIKAHGDLRSLCYTSAWNFIHKSFLQLFKTYLWVFKKWSFDRRTTFAFLENQRSHTK